MTLVVSVNGTDLSTQKIFLGGEIPAWQSAPESTRAVIGLGSRVRSILSRTDDVAARRLTLPIYFNTTTLAERVAAFDYLKGFHRQQITLTMADGTTTREIIGTVVSIPATSIVTANNPTARGGFTLLCADPLWRATADTVTAAASVTNLCLQSEALATTWSANGATITADTTVAPDGTTTADTVARTTSASDGPYQGITFTGNGTKVVSAFLKQGTAPAPGFIVYDVTAAAVLVEVLVTWTAGVPVLTKLSGSGTMFTAVAVGGGWYRVAFTADSVLAANTNRIYCYPSYFGGANGQNTYPWGVQAENAATAGPYVKTTTGTATAIAIPLVMGTAPVEDWTLDVAGFTSNLTVTFATSTGTVACTYTGSLAGGHTLHLNANRCTCLDDASNVIANWAGGFPALDPLGPLTITLSAAAGTPTGTLTYRPRYY